MTWAIIIITAIFSIMAFQNNGLMYKYQFNPYQAYHRKQYYRFLTHAFLHVDWTHLLFNMITLFFFGRYVEQAYISDFGNSGIFFYVILYFFAIVISSLPSFIKHRNDHTYNSIGASGAVSAVLFTYILFEPFGKIYIFFIPIGIPAIIFGVLYLIYSAYMARKNMDNIGHDAHFWGAVFGFVFPMFVEPRLFNDFISSIMKIF